MGKFLLIAGLAFLVYGCPQSDQTSYEPQPPSPAPPDAGWDKIKGIVAADCGPCHNGTKEPAFTSGAQFKASTAKAKLQGGLMPPPPKTISDADKTALLAYLGS